MTDQDNTQVSQQNQQQFSNNETDIESLNTEGENLNESQNNETEDNSQIEKLQKDLAQMTEAAKRAMADLQNFKKRSEEEKKSLQQFAAMSLILEFIPIVDNFKRAAQHIPDDISENAWVQGIINIEKQLTDLLLKQGLTEIKAENEIFDAQKHEALMQGPGEKDKVIEVFETGYMLGDKVLKPAKVKVGQGE